MAYERSFSYRKLTKSGIPSRISQDKVETFMLITCEYDIVSTIHNELITDLFKS